MLFPALIFSWFLFSWENFALRNQGLESTKQNVISQVVLHLSSYCRAMLAALLLKGKPYSSHNPRPDCHLPLFPLEKLILWPRLHVLVKAFTAWLQRNRTTKPLPKNLPWQKLTAVKNVTHFLGDMIAFTMTSLFPLNRLFLSAKMRNEEMKEKNCSLGSCIQCCLRNPLDRGLLVLGTMWRFLRFIECTEVILYASYHRIP